ncbi:MAG: hypothetical protein JXR95_06785 [Deltaproteobacteria bacterium]|nr:hypothetical protein [Deltaproteobacteria bacterium]
MRKLPVFLMLLILSCDDASTGQEFVTYTVHGVGDSSNSEMISEDGWTVNMTKAQLVVGSIKLCSHVPSFYNKSDSLTECGQVMGEMTTAKAFDFIEDTESELGIMDGISGQVNSTFYNHGYIWLTTQGEPVSLSDDLDGLSALVEGTATKDASSFEFRLEIELLPNRKGNDLISGISASGYIDTSITRLEVRSDPRNWLRYIDFGKMACEEEICTLTEGSTLWNSFYYGIVQGGQLEFEWK